MKVVEVKGLGITRQGSVILDGVDFEMDGAQHVGIIGPNGAGKSFMLRVLSADLVPSRGEVKILGKQFGKVSLWDLRKEIGFVSTRMACYYDARTTVFEVVASGFLGTYGLPEQVTEEQAEAAREMLEFFEMEDFSERTFETLSDGEKRKVLLSRAMVTEPKLLIFDEPCQGLDIPTRERFLADVDRLGEKLPIIYVTHHLEELPSCISDVLYLKDGAVFDYGKKGEMLTTEKVSALFDYPLEVVEKGGRWYVQHQ